MSCSVHTCEGEDLSAFSLVVGVLQQISGLWIPKLYVHSAIPCSGILGSMGTVTPVQHDTTLHYSTPYTIHYTTQHRHHTRHNGNVVGRHIKANSVANMELTRSITERRMGRDTGQRLVVLMDPKPSYLTCEVGNQLGKWGGN